MRNLRFLIFIFSFLSLCETWAHPVAYKDAIAVMTWNQPYLSDYWVAYTFRPNMAVAARAMRMEMRKDGELIVAFPQFDYLVKRWNNPKSQANIYAYGGAGGAKLNSKYGYAGHGGVEADAESRSLFIMGKWESTWTSVEKPSYLGQFRLGVAPYEAEYNEIASWFMVQFQYHPMLRERMDLTPLVRLFYKSVLFESGVSTRGDWMLNFMFHF